MRRRRRDGGSADGAPGALQIGAGAPERAERTLEQALGIQVRAMRKANGLTVTELAASAGLSGGMLSKIENGQISPSLSTLQLLARALNQPIARFFHDIEGRRDCSFVRAEEAETIQRRGTRVGHHYRLLGDAVGGDIVIEPCLVTLAEDAEPFTSFQHNGREFIYLLSGEVVYAHAAQGYHMRPGDAILFDSGAPHGPEKLVKAPLTFLSVIVYPRDRNAADD